MLVIAGAGYSTYGHWLLDFLPRVIIAKDLLGNLFDELQIPLPSGTPKWAERMLYSYCGLSGEQILYYNEMEDVLVCDRVCLPSFAHNGEYALHKIVRNFYETCGQAIDPGKKRKICISRRSFNGGRSFAAREDLEALAAKLGYDVVRPEELSFSDQATLFRSAECIVGEHGSGLHGSIFAAPGTIVGSVGFNWVQCHVSAAGHQTQISMNRIQDVEQHGNRRSFTATSDDLCSLLEMIDSVNQKNKKG